MPIPENAGPFERALRLHDWYYEYSDSYGTWQRGRARRDSLRNQREKLGCPFNLAELHSWVIGWILENFEEDEPDKWYRKGQKGVFAALKRRELITQERADEIEKWMEENDRADRTAA